MKKLKYVARLLNIMGVIVGIHIPLFEKSNKIIIA
jgi:hypothetical protein